MYLIPADTIDALSENSIFFEISLTSVSFWNTDLPNQKNIFEKKVPKSYTFQSLLVFIVKMLD
ncbi:hypothetical protein EAH81_27110 [Flavobacterium pectinovorum]|uniref:Uncharacterized protein n=1 Tax=Flavobacterium pectinovorum TaxID=29533 RepID=A0A502DZX3_9FLAO|nr:hypothetical protein EAH81_27110 [Flavobacterium pectinovorum]